MMVASHDTNNEARDNIKHMKREAQRKHRKTQKERRQYDMKKVEELERRLQESDQKIQELNIQLVQSRAEHSQCAPRADQAQEALRENQRILKLMMTKLSPSSSHPANNIDTKFGGSGSWLTFTPRLNGHSQSWPCLSPVSPMPGNESSGISPGAIELTGKRN
ncbi:hypothetical protein N7539_008698 [Penicillium diatomitis]|uniref:BZIP domain-containing protein n=1 Tax=Penicillium diatomitis TaxID=2819901 RepID=A0A9W9WQZ1_9EURO|nr:uncharacterized protein N7539_008612 [Penicillium diatomitis]XP_056786611.1 uncharacterized protein N7539_008634 [Penicillium diatomitis]XP_056786675.1 uncharacterized protein N7539_008698 [Penicillium diatomitis]KAJ5472043.1 hypothetical protein N7539_008612 [Penicillium diatomitis]KAJ5472065.1 hypothetical protein N7539_008634 [Penicillium diatomitis]KAJ5472129.1 hypothetical protein N7539_008698 [Penicillium diatomitis]